MGGGKILFWGGFLGKKRSKLVIIDGIVDGKKYVEVICEALDDFHEKYPDSLNYL